MSCASDYEPSESSKSPQSSWEPYSSPSQLVPQLSSNLTELTFVDPTYQYGSGPYLRITEQPQKYFRFRYVSEMVGTHGCLLGKSYSSSKVKTHPTVELVNYPGRALIKCQLSQCKSDDEHPHKLLDEQDRDMSHQVPEHGSYKVVFAGMGIIHTAKKEVSGWLYSKFLKQNKNKNFNKKEIEAQCENKAKTIDLNIVRLKFTAHDVNTGVEICRPVFSEPIYNLKCASTNDLKICRISRCYGRPKGGDDVFIFVEKVNKKNIQVRFFKLDDNEDRVWSANANFMLTDVHHQYAIAFRTPPYQDVQTPEDVEVFIELVRPSDGRTSAPMPFTYKAEQIYKSNKKRKTMSSFSSLESTSGSGGSIKSITDVPAPVIRAEKVSQHQECVMTVPVQQNVTYHNLTSQVDLGEAFMEVDSMGSSSKASENPMWGHAAIGPPEFQTLPDLRIDSTELEHLANRDRETGPMDSVMLKEYLSSLNSLNELGYDEPKPKPKETPSQALQPKVEDEKPVVQSGAVREYSAYYKMEDGIAVKQLVKELSSMLPNKSEHKKQELRDKLEKMFSYRLSNGDTFLHMTLCSNQNSFEFIVKIIYNVKMTHLLDLYNYKQQTVLHMAIYNDLPKMVTLLIAKGCNPRMKDSEGDNAVHYAARSECCLQALLDAIQANGVQCDLNDTNNERQSALHVSASEAGTRLLLQRGASYKVRDAQGRTPLHLAAYDNNLPAVRALMDFVTPFDIDDVDGGGNTALQIVCGGQLTENTVEIVKLLLEKKADPLKQNNSNVSAWKMARDQPKIREAMKNYVTSAAYEEDTKSEVEDEYESAEEDEGTGAECSPPEQS